MQRKSLRLHNNLAQSPMCFAAREKSLAELSDEYTGFHLDYGWLISARPTEMGYEEWYLSEVPGLFDFKVLAGLIHLADGSPAVTYNTMHALIMALGFKNEGRYYQKVLASILKWQKVAVTRGTLDVTEDSAIDFESFAIISNVHYRIARSGSIGAVRIYFNESFAKLTSGRNTALLYLDVIHRLKGEHAVNLYNYLRSFELRMARGEGLKRDLKPFARKLFHCSRENPFEIMRIIKRSITDINYAIGTYTYDAVRMGKFVQFIRIAERIRTP